MSELSDGPFYATNNKGGLRRSRVDAWRAVVDDDRGGHVYQAELLPGPGNRCELQILFDGEQRVELLPKRWV